ncbi:hypothetical protein [Kitasatospora sp. NPDC088134]|uniref:hypothetical protein n=1 Tax=Kitasatospora sp. NPDC088134 TaxID=3364071 RepID=UPI00381DF4BD
MSGLGWIPAACTLPTEERPLRTAEWDTLFAERVARVWRPQSLLLRLELRGGDGTEERVRDPAERAGGRCSFVAVAVGTWWYGRRRSPCPAPLARRGEARPVFEGVRGCWGR